MSFFAANAHMAGDVFPQIIILNAGTLSQAVPVIFDTVGRLAHHTCTDIMSKMIVYCLE